MRDPQDNRWEICKARLGQRIGPEDAAAWLGGLRLDALGPHRVVLSGVPNTFFKSRILHHFRPVILSVLEENYPEVGFSGQPELELHVAAEGGAGRPASVGAAPASAPGRSPADAPGEGAGSPPPERAATQRYALERFLPAPGNASALRFAQACVEAPGTRYNPLVIVGACGLGKTHLLQGIAQALRAGHPTWQVVTVTGEAFKNEVLEGITRRRMAAVRERYRSADALVLDDLEFLLVSPRAQEELLHTFDTLYGAGRQLVFSADRFPRALGALNDALRSRLEMGLVAEVGFPDAETRRALVRARAAAEGLILPEEVAALLAERVTQNLRQLEGAVVRLSAYAALHGRPITRAFAEEVAAPFFDARPGHGAPVGADAVLEAVAERFGLSVRSLKSRGRSANVVSARRVAIHLLKTEGALSYSEVGALLGNRSHSTIIHGHQTLLDEMGRDEQLGRLVQQLGQRLAGRAARP